MPSFSERIKEKASELGFCKVGVVPADILPGEGEHFFEWLDLGYHGEMAWLNREPQKRADPKLIFPAARSVIVTAINYYTPNEHVTSPSHGKISRYAWGDDYHDIVREKLYTLLAWIKAEVPGADGKVCVDTAPMLEKAWAVRAGLGWLGKHTNVITTDFGSWVFLGELLLNIDLEYDTDVVADHCGSCTACLDACPTQAIIEPYVVDSRKCLSYATIELRDEYVPDDIAENLNGWLYGCDICQDVCPWNRFEQPASETGFEPRNNETSLDLASLSRMTHEEYVERFRGSAMKRTKLSGLKRNAGALRELSTPRYQLSTEENTSPDSVNSG
ncbi:MAG TPA: tRNA epoxyqueuosine(34) reductase QueG [Pyrinomonadaceae bacterium]|nr:tRNA epoxyqueuosine(34) reductase QueG [Pyrinomonadaceae bacterium]